MSGPYVVEEREGERWLVVTGESSGWVADALDQERVQCLDLNYARGFSSAGLAFLRDLRDVRKLHLLDRSVVELDPIYDLAECLEGLSIQAAAGAELDFQRLPNVRSVAGDWDLIGTTLNSLLRLRAVITWGIGAPDLHDFRDHAELERLVVKDARYLVSLDGIADLTDLSCLRAVGVPKLRDIDAVASLSATLRELELQRCHRLSDLEAVAPLGNLQFLGASDAGDIASLAPLDSLCDLEVFHAWGTTNIKDGDLSPLTRLPRLREIRMRDRRTYQPSVKELSAAVF